MANSHADRDARPAEPVRQAGDAVMRQITSSVTTALDEALPAGLYLVATPIGNLADITLRALTVLARVDVIFCEDTRHSARLLQHYGIDRPTRALHDHNEDVAAKDIIGQLSRGQRVAVISDAGTPLVSDPGFRLTRMAIAEGQPVHVIPGPSALLAGLSLSGLPSDSFLFAGFLPAKQAARRAKLAELSTVPATLVFFESPRRLADLLADMVAVFGDRPAAIGRELTKKFEEIVRGPLSELVANLQGDDLRGECVVLVGQGERPEAQDAVIAKALAEALQSMRLKDAATAVAEQFGVAKSRVYAIGLTLKASTSELGEKARGQKGE